MTTRVRVITREAPAIVLSYPREADPVFGADFTEIAQLPPRFEQEFTVSPGFDLLVAEMPLGASPAGDGAALVPAQQEAASSLPAAPLREAC